MNIILHCGGMPFDGTTIEHQSLGGSETSAYYLAKHLALLGHRVILFTSCNKEQEGHWDGVDYVSHGKVSDTTPLGHTFHAYAENTPSDVMIIQRHPQAFQFKWASKVNVWWLHDIAHKRHKSEVTKQMWNVDIVWTVSEFHKKQVMDIWGFADRIVHPVKNGVDDRLVEHSRGIELPTAVTKHFPLGEDKKILIYSSRPERGLEHLVAPNGIMDRLGDDYLLLVCAYDNVLPSTKKYYDYLAQRCDELPNVQSLGHLSKIELYRVMQICGLHVYPTEFEEVSCITAMEDMACGLPMIASRHAALPETTKGGGRVLLNLVNGDVDIAKFVTLIRGMTDEKLLSLSGSQRKLAPKYFWPNIIDGYIDSIEDVFTCKSQESIIKHFVEHSDIIALRAYASVRELSPYSQWLVDRTLPLYDFANDPKTQEEHYENYYAGTTLAKQDMENSPRYVHISSLLGDLSTGSSVLDYGCGHGHYVVNLAKQYPDLVFIGIDVSRKNIEFAKAWAKEDNVLNIEFYYADIMQGFESDFWSDQYQTLDCILCAEVLEHVVDHQLLACRLTSLLKDGGRFIATTPYGRWEWQSFYDEYENYRFHLHHFEREDIVDMISDNVDDFITNIPAGNDKNGYLLGSYVWGFTKDDTWNIGNIDYDRKLKYLKPRQLVSLNMIAKDCQDTITQAINSTLDFVDEVVIGVDCYDTPDTDFTYRTISELEDILAARDIGLKLSIIESPLKTGFSVARNQVLDQSSLDWIMWIDSDEVATINGNSRRLLRSNEFNGYAVRQHHFSMDPPGVLKTDLPLRLFRNNIGVKFHGLVHEHPEKALNDGAGHAQLIDAVSIGHYGYDTEETRRGRFERNLDLMIRDREENPTRKLGKMLWVRDLSMMNQYEMEHNGMRITDGMVVRCGEGLKVWRELISEGETRLVLDSMQFYNSLLEVMGYEFEACLSIGMSKLKDDTDVDHMPVVKGLFTTRKDFENLTKLLTEENYNDFDSRYY